MGPGRHAVTYRLRGGALANFVGVVETQEQTAEAWTAQGPKEQAKADFAGWHPTVTNLIDRVPDDALFRWALYDRAPLPFWVRDRVVLLGDAAHPMLPFMAQGANMALEDAWALVACLDDPAKGPEAYQAMRAPRVSRVVTAARGNARNYHLSGVRRHIAHSLLRVAGRVAPKAPIRRFDWLYGFDVAKNINESDD
jgi:salicylate hydroxylase